MYKFSKESLNNLAGVHPNLVELCEEMLSYRDFKVIDGLRTPKEQRRLVERGASKTMNSKHLLNNRTGFGHAVDLLPFANGKPIDWEDTDGFSYFAGQFIMLADIKGVPIRWGADWDMDDDLADTNFLDYVHFEYKL